MLSAIIREYKVGVVSAAEGGLYVKRALLGSGNKS